MLSHCDLNLHFSDDYWYWDPFHVLIKTWINAIIKVQFITDSLMVIKINSNIELKAKKIIAASESYNLQKVIMKYTIIVYNSTIKL